MNEEQPSTEPVEHLFEVLPPEPQMPVPAPPKLRHALTLANLWHVWIGLKNGAPSSIIVYENIARQFCKFFGTRKDGHHHRLTPQGMVEWMQHLQTSKTNTKYRKLRSVVRINKMNMIVRSFLRWMKQMKYINDDLAACIPSLFPPPPKESVIFTEEEYEKLKAFCAGRASYQTVLWLVILGYRTGMSLVDCCHLRWKDVHLHDNEPSYIDIYRIKIKRFGEKARCQIPIIPFSDLHLWLLNLRNVTPWKRADGITDYVHNEAPAVYASEVSNFRGLFKNILYRAGIDNKKTFKCFRNSLCSNLVNSGMTLASVCQITGHNSVTTLLRYLKPDRRVLQDGMVKAQQYASSTVKGEKSTGLQPDDAAFL